jgi:DNA-directed RNA polymerase specialized sigma24 family protein
MTYVEISRETGIPAWEVRTLEKRALWKLQEEVKKPEYKELREQLREWISESSNHDNDVYI